MNSMIKTRYSLIVALLMLTLLNYGGVGYYFLIVLLPISMMKYQLLRLVNFQALVLILFSITFYLFAAFSDQFFSPAKYLMYLFLPVLFYLSGVLIAKNSNLQSLLNILLLLTVSIAAIPLLSVIKDILINGFITIIRGVPLIGSGDEIVNATFINACFVPIISGAGLILFKCNTTFDRQYKSILFILFAIVFILLFRIGSRTGLVLSALSFLLALLSNLKRITRKRLTFIIIFSAIVIAFIIYYTTLNNQILLVFDSRMNSDVYGVDTVGGRSQLWSYYLSKIFDYPFGGIPKSPFLMNSYAHNLWIDTARTTGLIPFIILIIFSTLVIKDSWWLYKHIDSNRFAFSAILLCQILILTQFFTEPILEGAPMLFMFGCFTFGMVKSLKNNFVRFSKKQVDK